MFLPYQHATVFYALPVCIIAGSIAQGKKFVFSYQGLEEQNEGIEHEKLSENHVIHLDVHKVWSVNLLFYHCLYFHSSAVNHNSSAKNHTLSAK